MKIGLRQTSEILDEKPKEKTGNYQNQYLLTV